MAAGLAGGLRDVGVPRPPPAWRGPLLTVAAEDWGPRLSSWISERNAGQPVALGELRRLAGGSSRQAWSLDARIGDAPTLPLVMRIDPNAAARERTGGSVPGFPLEFAVMRAMHRHGVPVPRVYWLCDDAELLGGPFYLMDRVEGETIPRRILRGESLARARAELPGALGRALALILSVDPYKEGIQGLTAPSPGRSAPETQLEQLRRVYDMAPSAYPTLELVFRWLERNLPAERARTLVHGDFRMGNLVVGTDGLRAVLDWELVHVGDPHEDLAWMCTKTWRFGRSDEPVGGVGQREPFFRAYEAESGRALDGAALRYWEILCSAKVAGVWIMQVRAYLSGAVPSVEQATIGRRMAETELDLLELLQEVR